MDVDLANAFHQIPIDEESSQLLSIMTPWGAYKPKFLPEGINVAPGILQSVVQNIFKECAEWMLVIFDNFLILGNDYNDLYIKFEKVLKIATEKNLQLKFAKTFLGFSTVKFFGFICEHNRYRVDPEKAAKVEIIPTPSNKTALQSFLGHGQMFAPHCKNYSLLAAPLTEMTKNEFNWKDPHIWNEERKQAFQKVKDIIRDAYYLYYPNYEWDFILIVDASKWGCAGVLYQINPDTKIHEPIACVSHKFSAAAQKWSGIDQEAFGNYWPILQLQKYLLGKSFILYTDHFNLLYIEKSIVPRIQRMKVFMQQFQFLIAHIKGKLNVVSDFWSRIYGEIDQTTDLIEVDNSVYSFNSEYVFNLTAQEKFNLVHGPKGHFGTRITYHKLNREFPGHRIPYREVYDMVQSCGICQKTRLGMAEIDTIEPVHRPLKQAYIRKRIGIDTLTVTPVDRNGNKFIYVLVVPTTKLVYMFPSKEHDGLHAAKAIFSFITLFGMYEEIISDPGTEFTAHLLAHLTEWFNNQQIFSAVDVHESNGVEGTNKQILRHLRALVTEKRFKDRWSDLEVIGLIAYILNSNISLETGCCAYELHFGRSDNIYFQLPNSRDPTTISNAYVRLLEEDLQALRAISSAHMDKVALERSGKITPETQNMYQEGDLVLLTDLPDKRKLRHAKLDNEFSGPYRVIGQNKNMVVIFHLALKVSRDVPVDRLKIYHHDNSPAAHALALELARTDANQFEIREITAYYGNPNVLKSMHFQYILMNGSIGWYPLKQISHETLFEEYVRNKCPELSSLLYTAPILKLMITKANQDGFRNASVQPNQTFYLVAKYFDVTGYQFDSLKNFPTKYESHFYYECVYTHWSNESKYINYKVLVLQNSEQKYRTGKFDAYRSMIYGSKFQLNPTTDTLITYELLSTCPKLGKLGTKNF